MKSDLSPNDTNKASLWDLQQVFSREANTVTLTGFHVTDAFVLFKALTILFILPLSFFFKPMLHFLCLFFHPFVSFSLPVPGPFSSHGHASLPPSTHPLLLLHVVPSSSTSS